LLSFSSIAKPLTNLTTKRVPERIPFRDRQRAALNELKRLLYEAVNKPLSIIDMSKQFDIYVDASNFAVGACMTQVSEEGERPVAFASCKFNNTHRSVGLRFIKKLTQLYGRYKRSNTGFLAGISLCIQTIIQSHCSLKQHQQVRNLCVGHSPYKNSM